MNLKLLNQIVRHVLANLLIIKSEFIDSDSCKSLKSKDFMLGEKLEFDTENGLVSNNLWGCQISTGDQEIKIVLGDCSQDNITEYCLIVQLKDTPAYGIYLVDDDSSDKIPGDAFLACTINEKDWLICNTYLQATFLSGMEQIKELGLSWNKCSNYQSQIDIMKSFIKYHESYYEEI